jgi:hypothetical protein
MKNNDLIADPKNQLPVTEFVGRVEINGYVIPCAVLYADTENPIRVFWQREVVGLLTGNKKGNLDRYFKPKNLQPYVPEKYRGGDLSKSTYPLKTINGAAAHGFLGSDLIDICKMYMQARTDGKLLPNQKQLAIQAEIIVFAFAKTGVDAIIDEATGYDKVRKDFSLIRNLKKYIADELQSYYSQFPIEFYQLIYKLNNWPYDDESIKKRPGVVGKWTNDIIYSRFPKGVMSKVNELNPAVKGHRKNKNYNHLKEVGINDLQMYISNAMFLMKSSANWRKFKSSLARALGKDYQGDMFDDY